MKKLLLSSIIMFAIGSVANAQNAKTDSKFQKVAAASATTTPAIQKAAVTTDLQTATVPNKTGIDKDAVATPTTVTKTIKVKTVEGKPLEAARVDASGVVINPEATKKQEIKNN